MLNKEVGLPHGKIQRVLQVLLGHQLSRSTSCRSMFRTAALGVATFQEATQALAKAEAIHPDETGKRMNGHKGWLHVLACPNAVVYRVARNTVDGGLEYRIGDFVRQRNR